MQGQIARSAKKAASGGDDKQSELCPLQWLMLSQHDALETGCTGLSGASHVSHPLLLLSHMIPRQTLWLDHGIYLLASFVA